jgi:hypothetical protein
LKNPYKGHDRLKFGGFEGVGVRVSQIVVLEAGLSFAGLALE